MDESGGRRDRRGWAAGRAIVVATAGFVLASLVTALFVQSARDTGQRLLSPLPAAPADLLLCVVAVAGALLMAWLGLGVVAAALSAVPGVVGGMARVVADRVAPVAVRRGVAFLLGAALVASVAPSTAAGAQLGPTPSPSSGGTTALVAPLPDLRPASSTPSTPGTTSTPSPPPTVASGRATTGAGPSLGPLGPSPPRESRAPAGGRPAALGDQRSTTESVVVAQGDTLWGIAARHLGSSATSARIAAEWPRWYAANADRIGGDPDLIQPGQRLVPPPPLHASEPVPPIAPTDGASP